MSGRIRHTVWLGTTPIEEPCAQVGDEDFDVTASAECRRYIKLLRQRFGDEPRGAELAVKWSQHEYGSYPEWSATWTTTTRPRPTTQPRWKRTCR